MHFLFSWRDFHTKFPPKCTLQLPGRKRKIDSPLSELSVNNFLLFTLVFFKLFFAHWKHTFFCTCWEVNTILLTHHITTLLSSLRACVRFSVIHCFFTGIIKVDFSHVLCFMRLFTSVFAPPFGSQISCRCPRNHVLCRSYPYFVLTQNVWQIFCGA